MKLRWLDFVDGWKAFFLFIRWIPKYYALHRDCGCRPDFYGWALSQYEQVIYTLTGGKLSKPTHQASTIIEAAYDYFQEEEENHDGDHA